MVSIEAGGAASTGTTGGSDLCTTCGLCCDGTLFDAVPLTDAEAKSFAPAPGQTESNRAAQPCRFLEGTCCGIYNDRFKACRRFRCELLKKLDAGGISLDEASALVVEAKRWRREALPEDGDASLGFRRRLMRRPELDEHRDAQSAAEGLKLAACRRFLMKHFVPRSRLKGWGWEA
jgi:hypothetical protein